jgi:preprotein translocase subunit SecA
VINLLESLIKKIFGDPSEKELKNARPVVEKINSLEPAMEKLSSANLQAKTQEFKLRLQKGGDAGRYPAGGFCRCAGSLPPCDGDAAFRCAAHRRHCPASWKNRRDAYGRRQNSGRNAAGISERLTGKGVHVVTVNDYLARRDSEDMGRIYKFLGLSVGLITHEMEFPERKAAYQADITYGTNNEFGFDYLRDNMVATRTRWCSAN